MVVLVVEVVVVVVYISRSYIFDTQHVYVYCGGSCVSSSRSCSCCGRKRSSCCC